MAEDRYVEVGDPYEGASGKLWRHGQNLAIGAASGTGAALLSWLLSGKKVSKRKKLLRSILWGLGGGLLGTGGAYLKDYANGTSFSHKYRVADPETDGENPLVVMSITGSGSGTHQPRSWYIGDAEAKRGPNRTAMFNPHLDMDYAKEYLLETSKKNPGARIRIVGHSHGGPAAYALAQFAAKKGIPIERLTTLDPIFRFRKLKGKPASTARWENYYTTKIDPDDISDRWALLGGRHGKLEGAENFPVIDPRYNNHGSITSMLQYNGHKVD